MKKNEKCTDFGKDVLIHTIKKLDDGKYGNILKSRAGNNQVMAKV